MPVKSLKTMVSAALLSVIGLVNATTTIGFSPLTSPLGGAASDGTTYVESGLTFTSTLGDGGGTNFDPNFNLTAGLAHYGNADPLNADVGGATLYDRLGSIMAIHRTGGGTFDLLSFDVAEASNAGLAGTFSIGWNDGAGTHFSTRVLDGFVGLQTTQENLVGLNWVVVQGLQGIQIDNVVVSGVSTVPEQGTLALMGIGLGALGFFGFARRR